AEQAPCGRARTDALHAFPSARQAAYPVEAGHALPAQWPCAAIPAGYAEWKAFAETGPAQWSYVMAGSHAPTTRHAGEGTASPG
nr:hypothetical protein [Tanacetum cinerariifolium]